MMSDALLGMMPFADAATPDLPLGRLLRLGLFQVSVAMALTLMAGTLNRVKIVELGDSASLEAAMFAIPLLVAPARALIGLLTSTVPPSAGGACYLGTARCCGCLAGLSVVRLHPLNGDRTI
jgi:hypothetical protein